jgi:aminoglycoside phosphotransferase (APT) family kinase protein
VWLGRTLAVLHRLVPGHGAHEDLRAPYGLHPAADWADWVRQASDADLPWADQAGALLPAFRDASVLVAEAVEMLGSTRALTHRDLGPPNLLLAADGPVLCDFGYAGPGLPWLEAVSAAVAFDAPELLSTYVAGGADAGPVGPLGLAQHVGGGLNWLAFNMWVSLGHRGADPARCEAATALVPELLTDFSVRMSSLEQISDRTFAAL